MKSDDLKITMLMKVEAIVKLVLSNYKFVLAWWFIRYTCLVSTYSLLDSSPSVAVDNIVPLSTLDLIQYKYT